MKSFTLILFTLLFSLYSSTTHQPTTSTLDDSRTEELDQYWATLAKAAKAGDFEGMKALYHEDAVLVKLDTTIAISDAFKYRWKQEIMDVKGGKLANTVDFRFSKRIGNNVTAYEEGIFHYTSVETATGKSRGDSYIHFEALLVKIDGKWLMSMEYQKTEATKEEWNLLK